MGQLDAVLELHERLLAELERRGVAIQERENEARHALEQILAQCAAERTSIAQEKSVLAQAGELYRRFADVGGTPPANDQPGMTDITVTASAGEFDPVEPDILPSLAAEQGQGAETRITAHSEISAEGAVRLHELCSDLRERIISSEAEEEQKANKWTDSLRGLLNREAVGTR